MNQVTHGVGAGLGVAGLVLLVVVARRYGDAWHVVSSAIFGAALVLLYSASTLYHSFESALTRQRLQKLDHAAIFLLIAGTYTPFVLVTLCGPWGWSLFGVVWGLAIVGVVLKCWFAGRFSRGFNPGLCGDGLAGADRNQAAAGGVAGGRRETSGRGRLVLHTAGAAFYLWKRLPYHHAVWHLFVLAGSACHWAAVFFFVLPRRG